MFSKLVMRLEEEQREIERATFDFPPESYAKFLEAVGKRNGTKRCIALINEALREDDEL